MSFFDKFKYHAGTVADAAGIVAQSAAKKAKTLASMGRVKLAIASEEDKMKKAYTELGRLFYRDYEAQTDALMQDYQPWCDKVFDAKTQIARLNEEMEKLRTEAQEEESADADAEPVIEVDLTEVPEDAAAESTETAEEAPETPEETPTVGTLYVDVTEPEE